MTKYFATKVKYVMVGKELYFKSKLKRDPMFLVSLVDNFNLHYL